MLLKKLKYSFFSILYFFFKKIQSLYYKSLYERYRYNYEIDSTFRFNGIDIIFHGEGVIKIGSKTYMGNRSSIGAVKGQKVLIGKNCSISHNVKIYTSNRKPEDIINARKQVNYQKGDVVIGDNCWIGANVFINQGVSLGNNVVVGANSVVTKKFPSNVVIAGCPAKIIKSVD